MYEICCMYGCPMPDDHGKTRNENNSPKINAEIKQEDGRVIIEFYSDCGKFGTNESLAGYSLTPEKLLTILHAFGTYSDDEII